MQVIDTPPVLLLVWPLLLHQFLPRFDSTIDQTCWVRRPVKIKHLNIQVIYKNKTITQSSSYIAKLLIYSYIMSLCFKIWNITILGKVSVTKWKTWMKHTEVKTVLACPQITYFQVDKGIGMTQSFTCCVSTLECYHWVWIIL